MLKLNLTRVDDRHLEPIVSWRVLSGLFDLSGFSAKSALTNFIKFFYKIKGYHETLNTLEKFLYPNLSTRLLADMPAQVTNVTVHRDQTNHLKVTWNPVQQYGDCKIKYFVNRTHNGTAPEVCMGNKYLRWSPTEYT